MARTNPARLPRQPTHRNLFPENDPAAAPLARKATGAAASTEAGPVLPARPDPTFPPRATRAQAAGASASVRGASRSLRAPNPPDGRGAGAALRGLARRALAPGVLAIACAATAIGL